MEEFVGNKQACEILGVHFKTLYNWDRLHKIDTIRAPGGKRLYNVKKFIQINRNTKYLPVRRNICYCRVSTYGQKDDLQRQINYMKQKYPNNEIIKDIGSGLNFKRNGLNKIINYAIKGEINELVIGYKDRLCRFGFDLIKNIIEKHSNRKIIILNDVNLSPNEELIKDLLSIINVFSARINGLRRYRKNVIHLSKKSKDNKNNNKYQKIVKNSKK